jgi:hypothetical protein
MAQILFVRAELIVLQPFHLKAVQRYLGLVLVREEELLLTVQRQLKAVLLLVEAFTPVGHQVLVVCSLVAMFLVLRVGIN